MLDFEYLRPKTLKEASKLLAAKDGNAIPYAGGTDLLALIKNRVLQPDMLVNLKSIQEYKSIQYIPGEELTIGALISIDEIANNKFIQDNFQVLAEAAEEIASPQLRNMGTLGGNLCQRPRCSYYREDFDCIRKGGDTCYAYDGYNKYHCVIGGSPCFIVHPSDMAVALLALDATISIYSNGNFKSIPIADFFVLPDEDPFNENILKPGELVTKIQVPKSNSNFQSTYIKVKERGVWDFATVSIGAVVEKNRGVIRKGKIAFGGIAPKPWVDEDLNKMLIGLKLTDKSIEDAAVITLKDAYPLDMNEYKIILARNLVRKVLMGFRY